MQMDRFLMEFDTERAGGFEPLRFVPKGKTVVLGSITTKSRNWNRKTSCCSASSKPPDHVPVENLALSTQCGFASAASGISFLGTTCVASSNWSPRSRAEFGDD